jgi:hypothetical protein
MPNSCCLWKARPSPLAWVLPFVLHGASAWAQPRDDVAPPEPALRMTWESDDPSCDGDEVTARALRLVTPGVVPRPLRARVEVRRDGEQWLVRLQTESGELSGRRMLRADSCHEIQQAIALLLAMAMESKGDVMPSETPAPEAPPPPPASAPKPAVATPPLAAQAPPAGHDAPPAAEPRERAGVGIGWFARLDGKAGLGLMPGLGLGAGVTAGIRLGDVDLGVSGAFWPETRAQVLDGPGRLSIARLSLGLRGCWNAWHESGWVLAPCLAPELTYFRYVSEELAETERGRDDPLLSITGALDVRYELVRGWLSLLISPGLTLERKQPFELGLDSEPMTTAMPTATEIVEVYKTKGIAPRLEVGVDARF